MFPSDMRKQVSTKKLLQALLQTYMDTNDLKNVYNGDGSELVTVDEAVEFVDGLKEEATPEQVRFESLLDTMMEEFRTHFPSSVGEAERGGSWFDLMHSIWNNHVQAELMKRYSNL
tara:strand:+ start:6626 stop:6973 length:348 start_codon:yes stop_codon:yes gene_type:complete